MASRAGGAGERGGEVEVGAGGDRCGGVASVSWAGMAGWELGEVRGGERGVRLAATVSPLSKWRRRAGGVEGGEDVAFSLSLFLPTTFHPSVSISRSLAVLGSFSIVGVASCACFISSSPVWSVTVQGSVINTGWLFAYVWSSMVEKEVQVGEEKPVRWTTFVPA